MNRWTGIYFTERRMYLYYRLVKTGTPLQEIAQLMGHGSTDTALLYTATGLTWRPGLRNWRGGKRSCKVLEIQNDPERSSTVIRKQEILKTRKKCAKMDIVA